MIRLEDTSGGAIARAIAEERHHMGSPATGMVLTMLILSNEELASDATEAAVLSARQHPMRILTLIPRPGRGPDQIDAQVMARRGRDHSAPRGSLGTRELGHRTAPPPGHSGGFLVAF